MKTSLLMIGVHLLCYCVTSAKPTINIIGNYTDLQVGSTADITCQTNPIIPNVTITWYNVSSNTIINSTKLTLSPVTLYDHNILYTCVLMYPSLENKTINITVQNTTVTQVSILSLQTGYIGRSTVIVCNITLNRAIGPDLSVLNYTWYHINKITDQQTFSYSINRSESTTSLETKVVFPSSSGVQPSNAGVYQCSAGIVGSNTIISNTTSLCVKVHENDLLYLKAFQGLHLGETFIHNCVHGSVTDLSKSISWWRNNTLFIDDNRIETLPLQLFDNNTNYTCIITLQQNPSGCPQNQSREYVIRLKTTYVTSVLMKSTVTGTIGSSTVIICNITLNTDIGPDLSALNYIWYHNNIDITNRSEILELNSSSNTITVIQDITSTQLSDTGVYECRAGIVGNNLMMNAITKLCTEVAERKFSTQDNFTDLQLGNQLTVSCINEPQYPEVSVSWLDSNGLYYSTNNTLIIPSLQLSHNNTIYTCVVSIQDNPTGCLNQSREFVIIEKNTYVTSVSMKPTVTANIGSSAVIVCNITLNTAIGPDLSVLKYYWYHNNTDITIRSEILEQSKETNIVTTKLNITTVQTSNAGVYNCTAGIVDSDIETKSSEFCVEVDISKIKINGNYTNLRLGDIKKYDCTSGYTESGVTVQWKSSDVVFNNPLIITVNQSVNNTRYTCIITVDSNPNSCKSQRKDLLLTVKDTFVTNINISEKSLNLSTPQNLSCAITTNTGINTTKLDNIVNVIWYQYNGTRNNVSVFSNNYRAHSTTSVGTMMFESKIEFVHVRTSMAGQYTCISWIGEELYKNMSDSTDVTVKFPINSTYSITIDPLKSYYDVGTNVTLTCTTIYPSSSLIDVDTNVTIQWKYRNNTIKSYTTFNDYLNHTLQCHLNSLKLSDAGKYICSSYLSTTKYNSYIISSNIITSNTMLVVQDVTVHVSTNYKILLSSSPHNNIKITCSVSYEPQSLNLQIQQFYWFQTVDNGVEPLNVTHHAQSNATHSILELNLTQSGMHTFKCIVNFLDQESPYSNIVAATVKNPSYPLVPINITSNTLNSTSVNISWIITEVTYTPENYTIYYWALKCNQTVLTKTTNGNDILEEFVSLRDKEYFDILNDLLSGTQYSYYISSLNSEGNEISENSTFHTNEKVPSGSPQQFKVVNITAYSIYFQWQPPPECLQNGVITNYSINCNFSNYTHPGLLQELRIDNITQLEHLFEDLLPFTEYKCQLTAFTSVGEGPATNLTIITNETEPSSPINLTIKYFDSTTLMLSWLEPVPPNGIITEYFINCSSDVNSKYYTNHTTDTTGLISGLQPFTNYTCSVTAYTKVGGGPPMMPVRGQTDQSIPEEVQNPSVRKINFTHIALDWEKPLVPNGIITHYEINVTVIDKVENQTRTKYPGYIIELAPYTPYIISIAGHTIKGRGRVWSSEIVFTLEGTPHYGPQNITGGWLNRTSIEVSWLALSLVEARGFITNYTVTVQPAQLTSSNRKREETSKVLRVTTSSSNKTSFVIRSSLDPTLDYVIAVSASTKIGESTNNINITLSALEQPTSTSVPVVLISVVVVVTFGLILFIFLLIVCILCVKCCHKNLHSKMKVKVKEMYTYSREINKNEDHFELPIIEDSLYQNVRVVVDTSHRISIKEFPSFVKNSREILQHEYEDIDTLSPLKSENIAKKNAERNRFQNISPFDDNIVPLSLIEGEEGSDYINASYVNGYKRKNAYIATQGPLPNTVVDFWRMIWEYKLPTIVMLTQLVEKGTRKCACYWPEEIGKEEDIGHGMNVTLQSEEIGHYFTKKKLSIRNANKGGMSCFDVTHYHFSEWPDHGVPTDKMCMIEFIGHIRKAHPPEGAPLVVHCSAGVGRTGTFIVLDTMLQRVKQEESLNIYDFLLEIRHQRVKLVQTETQYLYIHECLSEYIQCGNTSFPITGTYDITRELSQRKEGKSGFEKQFELLEELSDNAATLSCSDAEDNHDKNRYSYNLPYDHTRVQLSIINYGDNDYINASWIDGYKNNSTLIATQSPLKETENDFWKMIWEQQSVTIVLLSSVDEYLLFWPNKVDEEIRYDKIIVTLMSKIQDIDYTVYSLELKSKEVSDVTMSVSIFWYVVWYEHTKPLSGSSLLNMFDAIVKNQSKTGNQPITVVCNDGVGRSGTFVSIYSELERVKMEGVADIFQFIKKARSQRAGLVQEVEQYIFCHEVLSEYAEEMSKYDNFKNVI